MEQQPIVRLVSMDLERGIAMKSVLLVEDDRGIATVIKEVRLEEGYGVIVATDGARGLELLGETTPDLVLSNVNLPQVSGVDLAQRVKHDPALPAVPVVLMSASWEPGATGFFADYLRKPFTLEAPLDLVTRFLGSEEDRPSG